MQDKQRECEELQREIDAMNLRLARLRQEAAKEGGMPYQGQRMNPSGQGMVPPVQSANPPVFVQDIYQKGAAPNPPVFITNSGQNAAPNPPVFINGTQMPQKQRNIEKTIGKTVMGIGASILIFISIILFATLVLPYLNDTVKMLLMYAVSILFTTAGCLLLWRDRNNKWYLSIAGCGIGAIYISLFLSAFYFDRMSDIALYLCCFVWAALVCVLSRLRSEVFLVIGQLGIMLSVVWGILFCWAGDDATKLLFLVIYYMITSGVFYISHWRREYNANLVNHIFLCVGLFWLLLGTLPRYVRYAEEGTAINILLIVAAVLPVVMSMTVFRLDTKKNTAFGILDSILVFIAYLAFLCRFEQEMPLMLILLLLALAALELRFPATESIGKTVLMCTLFFLAFLAVQTAEPFGEYASVAPFVMGCLLYGFLRENKVYKIAGLVYGILFLLVSMNEFLHLWWGLALAAEAALLLYCCRGQYRTWMKVVLYITSIVSLQIDLAHVIELGGAAGQSAEILLILGVVAAINILMMKLPVLRRNPATGQEEDGVLIATGIVEIYLMLGTLLCIMSMEGGLRAAAVIIGIFVFGANSYGAVRRSNHTVLFVYVSIKEVVFLFWVLIACGVPGFLLSLAGIGVALVCIAAGFALDRRTGRNFGGFRICGLVLALLSMLKLILFDINYESTLLRAVSFFVSGLLCFAISLIYHLVDGWVAKGRRR